MTPEESAALRRQLTEAATGELQRMQQLTSEIAAARLFRQNPVATDADHIRRIVIAVAASIDYSHLPRGYRVLGGTPSTPYYLMRGKVKPTDAELIADAAMGWLSEIAAMQQKTLDTLRPTPAQSTVRTVALIESRDR